MFIHSRSAKSPSTVKEEIFVGEKFHTFLSKTFRMEFKFIFSVFPKLEKTIRDYLKDCKPGGRKFGMEINFVIFFPFYESYEIKFPTKISSFTVLKFTVHLLSEF